MLRAGRNTTLAVTILLAGACSNGGGAASGAASPNASGAGTSPATETCLVAVEQARSTTDPSLRAPLLLRGCADVWSRPGCRRAWRDAAQTTPDRRIGVVVAGCRAAYCGALPLPEPALCAADPTELPATELAELWPPFASAVLAREIPGEEHERIAAAFASLGVVVVAPEAASADPRIPRVAIRLAREGAGLRLSATVDGQDRGSWTVPAEADAERMRAVLAPALSAPLGNGVVVTAGAEVSYAAVVSLMDALRAFGLADVVLSTAP